MDRKKSPDLVSHPALWKDGSWLLVGLLPGCDQGGASDINEFQQVIGLCGNSNIPNDRRAFLWQNGITHDLNDLVVPGSASVIQRANAINDAGNIIGDGRDLSGHVVTFLLTPSDRPIGDINIDCHVGVADLVILLDDWAQSGSPADVNDDGIVNVLDLIIVLLNFGS